MAPTLDILDLAMHVPGFLDRDSCRMFVDFFDQHRDQAQRETSLDFSGRRRAGGFDCVTMPDHGSHAQIMLGHVARMVRMYRQYLIDQQAFHDYFIANMAFNYVRKFRVLRYAPGASIHAHVDAMPWVHGSLTLALNQDYTGGDFVFMRGRRRLRLDLGDALIFPADMFWVHETLPVESGNRYCFNCFLQSVPRHQQESVLDAMTDMHHLIDEPTYITTRDPGNMTWI